jgi:hypothetical protein
LFKLFESYALAPNRMKKILLFSFLHAASILIGQTPAWQWSRAGIGATYHDMAFGTACDLAGNGFVTGYFDTQASFGSTVVTSAGYRDMFVAKYSSTGNLLWVNSGGGTGDDVGNAIATDVSGNCYVVGAFNGTASFGTTTLTSIGSGDWFVIKYDPSGNLLWAKKGGSVNGASDVATAVVIDGSGKCIVGGRIMDNATFGSLNITSSSGQSQIAIVKYDALGNELSATGYGGMSVNDYVSDLDIDDSSNVYMSGWYENGTTTIGTFSLSNSGSNDMFLAKINPAGIVQWADHAGGSTSDYGYGIAVTPTGQTYVCGSFSGVVLFGSTALSSSSGSADIFTAGYSSSGVLLWVKKAGSSSSDAGTGVDVDTAGNVYISGHMMSGTLGPITVTSAGDNDVLVAKYNAAGTEQWAKTAGSVSDDRGYAIAVTETGGIYTAGYFYDSAFFDSLPLLLGPVGYDLFLARIGIPEPDGISESSDGVDINVYPNPAGDMLNVDGTALLSNYTLSIFDLQGQLVLTETYLRNEIARVDVTGLSPAVYVLQIQSPEKTVRKRVIIR